MVQRIDLTGRVFRMLKENNLMIEELQHPTPNQDEQPGKWMLEHDIPSVWSNHNVNIDVNDQPDGKGFPILRPIKRIADEEYPDGGREFRFPHYWEMKTQQIKELIKEQGTDALAWYRPFHMDLQEKWGITILDQGIWYVARKLAEKMYSKPPYTANEIQQCRNLALDFLYHHEMFHFKVELAATMMELINPNEPIYAPYWSPQDYREWFASDVKSHPMGKAPLEEALANSYAWDKVYSEYEKDERKVVKKAIREFIKTQPDGYNHGLRLCVGGPSWKAAMNELINKLLNATDEDDLFSPHRTLLSQLFFTGGKGKEDWIDEYYAGIVPCRILNTGFAEGRFSSSTEEMDFGIWCVSSKFYGKFKNFEGHIQETFESICQEYSNLTLGKGIKDPRAYDNFRKNRQIASSAGKFDKGRKTKQNIFYFRFVAQNYRAYHEMNRSDEEVLILTHRKRGNKLKKKYKNYLHGSNRSGIIQHEIDCKNKS